MENPKHPDDNQKSVPPALPANSDGATVVAPLDEILAGAGKTASTPPRVDEDGATTTIDLDQVLGGDLAKVRAEVLTRLNRGQSAPPSPAPPAPSATPSTAPPAWKQTPSTPAGAGKVAAPPAAQPGLDVALLGTTVEIPFATIFDTALPPEEVAAMRPPTSPNSAPVQAAASQATIITTLPPPDIDAAPPPTRTGPKLAAHATPSALFRGSARPAAAAAAKTPVTPDAQPQVAQSSPAQEPDKQKAEKAVAATRPIGLRLVIVLLIVAAVVAGAFFLLTRFPFSRASPESTATAVADVTPPSPASTSAAEPDPVADSPVVAADTVPPGNTASDPAAVTSPIGGPIDTSSAPAVTTPPAPESSAATAAPATRPTRRPRPRKEAPASKTSVVAAPPQTEIPAEPAKPPPPPPTAEGDLVLLSDAGVTAPVVKRDEVPRYPVRARMSHATGTVIVSLLVDHHGNVAEAKIAKSSGNEHLDNSALLAVKRTVFTPATKDGVPVRVRITRSYVFKE